MTIDPSKFERTPVQDAKLSDLDLDLVRETIRRGVEAQRYQGNTDPMYYLDRYGAITKDQHPTITGILAFCHEPDRWLTVSGIDIAIQRNDVGSTLSARVRQLRGSIFYVIDQAVSILEDECAIGYLEGARIVRELDIPLTVLRELTTNAVTHRDLSLSGSQVRLQISPSYIDWISPGNLPPGVTLDNIISAQVARNQNLATILFHGGYIEKFGMGLDQVFKDLSEQQLPDPQFFDEQQLFRVRVTRKQAQIQRPDISIKSGRFLAILDLFNEKPTWKQREILERLDISRATLQRDLDELLESGKLVVTGATRSRVYQLGEIST
jgi:ATP-dependent DNA helicase RecG